ncbi:MAG TPA: hypothetical protein VMV10_03270 [Pirellulales bacterium]|nr:hypothetical protein [Pirellulales bacterium]
MLQIKLMLLVILVAAGQGIARLPGSRMTHERAGIDEQIARGGLLQQLEAVLDRFNAEQKASQLRLERLRAARNERERATKLAEAMLNEKLEELERLRAEQKQLNEELKKLIERRRPVGPGQFKPQLRPRFDLQPIERKPFNSPPHKMKGLPPPRIDDIPPLGPVAFAGETPMISARV